MKNWIETSAGEWMPVEGDFTVGRFAGNSLVTTEKRVSRYHAMIRIRQGKAWLVDLNSRNGVLCNGRLISSPRCLREGDMIQVGSVPFIFREGELPSDVRMSKGRTPSTVSDVANLKEKCWVVAVKVKGFAEHTQQLAPGVLEDLLTEWSTACGQIAKSSGGFSERLLGDRMFLYWPVAEQSAATLMGILNELDELRVERYLQFVTVVHQAEILTEQTLVRKCGEEPEGALKSAFKALHVAEGLGEDCLFTEVAATALAGLTGLIVVGDLAVLEGDRLYGVDPLNGSPTDAAHKHESRRVLKAS